MKSRHSINARTLLSLAVLGTFIATGGNALAKGGTAKPPTKGVVAPFITPTLPDPVFTVNPGLIHGFDVTGFIEDATVSNADCAGLLSPNLYGGTVTVNGVTITVPCNSVIQMPANTLTWADFVNAAPSLTLKSGSAYPSFEVHVIGNTIDTKQVAGLIYISQQSLNSGSGFITKIDYATGNIEVDSGVVGAPPVVLQINDPNGRFGRIQSPDPRFSVDDTNSTIHAATGYPMCVPRSDPSVADDPLCPQKNRPAPPCRNFSVAGVAPPVSGELSPAAFGQAYCSQYVMKSVADATRVATDADPRQQAPLEVGDFISYSGTMFKDATGTTTYTSVHTIEANVGIYTQPGTQPSYLAIGEFGIGTADPVLTAVNGAAQETQNRIFLEASTTDVKTPVDIYYVDVDPVTGAVHNRWVTPYEMTGECNPALTLPASCYGVSGGITTQNTGPQPQRARVRATKAPIGLLSQPTRNLRVMVRSRCVPTATADQPLLDACIANATVANGLLVANGLNAGQYAAPVFEYIFPENVKPGDPVVPADFWHLPFLRNGEGLGVGPLLPTPW
ncbi:MAG: hypothetical protein ACXW11_07030 [Methylotenera sp.]